MKVLPLLTGSLLAAMPLFPASSLGAEPSSENRPEKTADAPRQQPARLASVFTFFDAVYDSGKVWTLEDVKHEMVTAKSLGIQRIYWRIDAAGYFMYPTRTETMFTSDGIKQNNINVAHSIANLGDPLRVFAEEAKRAGIEFYAWYPVRDRNSTSDTYNSYNPEEARLATVMGRYPYLSPFLARNPHFNSERRQRDGAHIPIPTITTVTLKTSEGGQAVTKDDIRLWQSDDNLRYDPVPDTWSITRSDGPRGTTLFTISGLEIAKPWIKIAQRVSGQWSFSGGSLAEWITIGTGGEEWSPYLWLASGDLNPAVGEARFPYINALRGRAIRNSVPWDATTQFRFGHSGHSAALYTPRMPPYRYLYGDPCFAYPEVREHTCAVIRELLEYPIDGIALCLRQHTRTNGTDEYGFNPPIVEEYRKRHGIDILTEDYDAAEFWKIHGDFYTQLLREIRPLVRAKERKLVAMFEPEPEGLYYMPGQTAPWWYLGKIDWQWQKWAQEDLVDTLLVFTSGFNLPWDKRLQDYLSEVRAGAGGKEVSLFYDPDYNPERQDPNAFINLVSGALASPDIDELNLFEFVEMHLPAQPLYNALLSLKLNETPAPPAAAAQNDPL